MSRFTQAISYQLSAISYQLSTISYQLSAISYQSEIKSDGGALIRGSAVWLSS
jgi:hypothetical protein